MNTHILIPIKEYNKIALLGRCEEQIEKFELMFANAKQISLSEEDIEEKAQSYGENGNWELFEYNDLTKRKEAYKQALKDLL